MTAPIAGVRESRRKSSLEEPGFEATGADGNDMLAGPTMHFGFNQSAFFAMLRVFVPLWRGQR